MYVCKVTWFIEEEFFGRRLTFDVKYREQYQDEAVWQGCSKNLCSRWAFPFVSFLVWLITFAAMNVPQILDLCYRQCCCMII